MKHYALHDGHIVEGGPPSLMRAIYGRDDRLEYVLDYDKENVAKVIDEVFDTLSERESLVIKGRFGLNPGDSTPKTLEQTSRSLRAGTPFGKDGVTRERIRQIEADWEAYQEAVTAIETGDGKTYREVNQRMGYPLAKSLPGLMLLLERAESDRDSYKTYLGKSQEKLAETHKELKQLKALREKEQQLAVERIIQGDKNG